MDLMHFTLDRRVVVRKRLHNLVPVAPRRAPLELRTGAFLRSENG